MNLVFPFFLIVILINRFESLEGELTEKWIEQPQDHFDSNNNKTWLMRYYENNQFFHEFGPIFILISGETKITSDLLETDFMHELAKIHGAMMYNTEHRYYGRSHPVPDTSFSNLRYLRVRQALADIALFIETKKKGLNIPNAPVIVFGASYAGNLAAWMRVEYPNLVQGALANSAPIHVKANFFEFYEAVADTFHKYDEECALNIKEAFSDFEQLLRGPAVNPIKLKDDFYLCSEPDLSQPAEISLLMVKLAEAFGYAALYNTMSGNGHTLLTNLCFLMTEDETVSSYYKLSEVLRKTYLKYSPCININYHQLIEDHVQTSWELQTVAERLWFYQACTEFGYHQTSSSPHSIFGSLFPLQYYMNLCKDLFTEEYNLDSLNDNIERVNCMYNSRISDVKRIIFTNGDRDPWNSISVLSDLNPDSPSILIEGASHSNFLQIDEVNDTGSLKEARCRVFSIIYEWLSAERINEFNN